MGYMPELLSGSRQERAREVRDPLDVGHRVHVAERGANGADGLAARVGLELLERHLVIGETIVEEPFEGIDRVAEHLLVDAGIAEAAGADVDAVSARRRFVDPGWDCAVAPNHAERHDVAPERAVHPDVVLAHAERAELLVQIGAERGRVALDVPERRVELEALADERDGTEIDRAVLVARVAERLGREEVFHHADEQDRAACEPPLVEQIVALAPDEHAANSRRIPEHLVERDRNVVGLVDAEVQAVVRDERGCVEQDCPAMLMSEADPVE